jgi:mono/diheme cytochrome c family protein
MKFTLFILLLSHFLNNSMSDNYSSHIYQEKNELNKSIENGKEIYKDFCIQCHLGNGKGFDKTIPTLDNSDWLIKKRKESIHAVKFGQRVPIVVNNKKYNGNMPPMNLTDKEVADVMNYIMNSWSNKQKKPVTTEEVSLIKK